MEAKRAGVEALAHALVSGDARDVTLASRQGCTCNRSVVAAYAAALYRR